MFIFVQLKFIPFDVTLLILIVRTIDKKNVSNARANKNVVIVAVTGALAVFAWSSLSQQCGRGLRVIVAPSSSRSVVASSRLARIAGYH